MTSPNEPTEPDSGDVGEAQPVAQKRSGEYQFACGHRIVAAIDTQQRHRCSRCGADTIVVRIIR